MHLLDLVDSFGIREQFVDKGSLKHVSKSVVDALVLFLHLHEFLELFFLLGMHIFQLVFNLCQSLFEIKNLVVVIGLYLMQSVFLLLETSIQSVNFVFMFFKL